MFCMFTERRATQKNVNTDLFCACLVLCVALGNDVHSLVSQLGQKLCVTKSSFPFISGSCCLLNFAKGHSSTMSQELHPLCVLPMEFIQLCCRFYQWSLYSSAANFISFNLRREKWLDYNNTYSHSVGRSIHFQFHTCS